MTYHQITSGERYMISALRRRGCSIGDVARQLGRHRSTIGRELTRNSRRDGWYRPSAAVEYTNGRRSRSRRNTRFSPADLARVEALLAEKWSPEQIAGYLRRLGELRISHETIYRHVWRDKRTGGGLYLHLRGARKQKRKRYGHYDSRSRLAGKRHISERPAACEHRRRFDDWEIDTVLGTGSRACVLSLVERKCGFLLLGRLAARTVRATSARTVRLMRREGPRFLTVTADNGTEFHGYRSIERATGVPFYFATPAPCVGARDLREHQWPAPPVSAQGRRPGDADASRLRPHRPAPQSPPPQALGLPHTGGMLLWSVVSVAVQS